MSTDRTSILVLNHNGRDLLAECLPSIVVAASRSPIPCEVIVVDNESTDDSLAMIRQRWPQITIECENNRGLCSFNRVLSRRGEDVVFLLNNDVKLDPDAIAPLLRDQRGSRRTLRRTTLLDL